MIYKVSFTPAEPYFFGNERSFRFPGQNVGGEYSNSYFIRSEDMPSQSTILGTLRYLMMPKIREDFRYTDDEKKTNEKAVGQFSFSSEETDQTFGVIKEISPVFLEDENGEQLIPCPLNHSVEKEQEQKDAGTSEADTETETDKEKKEWYCPFCECNEVTTSVGRKLYFNDYDVKKGLADGFLRLSDCQIIKTSTLVNGCERVGINRTTNKKGFFRKEYKSLKCGYAFTVYADLDIPEDDDRLKRKIVTMGQGKSPFAVKFVKEDNAITDFYDRIERMLKDRNATMTERSLSIIYCLSDAFTDAEPGEGTLFAAYKTKEYRAYGTVIDHETKRVVKGEKLYRLFKAGSIFIIDNTEACNGEIKIKNFHNSSVEEAGYNKFIEIGGNK